jgi:hypothetical protein
MYVAGQKLFCICDLGEWVIIAHYPKHLAAHYPKHLAAHYPKHLAAHYPKHLAAHYPKHLVIKSRVTLKNGQCQCRS